MSSNRCRPEALARVSFHFFTTPNALQELGWGMMQHPPASTWPVSMSLFTLPASVRQVFAGLRRCDIPATQAGFLNEAVLTEGGRRYRGETLGAWLEARATGHIDRAINESSVSGSLVVTTFCTARPASGQAPAREHDWTFKMQGERISAVDVELRRRPSLPCRLRRSWSRSTGSMLIHSSLPCRRHTHERPACRALPQAGDLEWPSAMSWASSLRFTSWTWSCETGTPR